MSYATCFVLIVFASISFASIFDQTQVLDGLLTDHLHMGRFKRSPKKMECCGEMPEGKQMDLMKKCDNEMEKGNFKDDDEMMKKLSCAMECMMIETKMLKDGKIIDKAAFLKFLDENENDDYRKKKMGDSYDQCVQEGNEVKKAITEKIPNLECDAFAVGFGHCQMRETIMNCPANKFNNEPHCKKLKEMFEKEE